jgi:serine/threonine protein kinase
MTARHAASPRGEAGRGVQAFATQPCDLTGHMVRSFCNAALERATGRRNLISLFDAFIDGEPRGSVPQEELFERLKIGHYVNSGARLRDVVTQARQLAWDLAYNPSPGQAFAPNLHLLMPTINRERGEVALERVFAVRRQMVGTLLSERYGQEHARLLQKFMRDELDTEDYLAFGALSYLLHRYGAQEFAETGGLFFEFKIIENLRRTDFRIVDIAEAHRSGTRVVLKRLTPEGARIERERLAFIRGADAIEGIRDTEIPRVVHPLSEHAGILYYAVEYRAGQPLGEAGPFDRSQAILILLQLANVLCRLLDHDLLHGDLSLDNVIRTDSGEISLLDFECAAPVETSRLSRSYARSTTYYMSPERRADAGRLKPSDDVYAFGVLAAQLLSGRRDEAVDEMIRHLRDADPDDGMVGFLTRCLSDERAGRYVDVKAMEAALRTVMQLGRANARRPIVHADSALRSLEGQVVTSRSFANLDLRGVEFSGGRFTGCDFSNALLSNATFQNAMLTDCCFDGAFMLSCRFHEAGFGGKTSFIGANLERTVWDGARLAGVDFGWANFWGAFLGGATGLGEAKIGWANFCRNELSEEQRLMLDSRQDVLRGSNYGEMIAAWNERERALVWWLREILEPGGLVSLY